MEIIGFASEYYTLWDLRIEPIYFTDSFGNHHLVRNKQVYSFIKNLSTDLGKVKVLYPDTQIDDSLRGQHRSFSICNDSEDLSPEILKFGKYYGRSIHDIMNEDFGYILWLVQNTSSKTSELCKTLSKVTDHHSNLEKERLEKINSHPVAVDGLNELLFLTNPNYFGYEIQFIQENSTKISDNIPETIEWIEINDFTDSRKDWFCIIKSKCDRYKIYKYREQLDFHMSSQNFKTIEEAKRHAEICELYNRQEIDKYKESTKFTKFLNMYYAVASLGENSKIFVFFEIDIIKQVSGKYPYNMLIVANKALKIRDKKIKIELEILHTENNEQGIVQYVKANLK